MALAQTKWTPESAAMGNPNGGFQPLETLNLSEAVADQIVEAIGSRRKLPGQRHFEAELAQQLSISRIAEGHLEIKNVLLSGSLDEIASAVARHVIGPFDSKTIAERAYEAAAIT